MPKARRRRSNRTGTFHTSTEFPLAAAKRRSHQNAEARRSGDVLPTTRSAGIREHILKPAFTYFHHVFTQTPP